MINTKHLFLERLGVEDQKRLKPDFTIYEHDIVKDGRKIKSLYQIFMSSVDEYDFAMKAFGNLAEWNQLLQTKWFSEGYRAHRGIEAWREDMRARDESRAKQTLMLAVSEGDVSAAKKLYDMSKKKDTSTSKRGRFIKDEAKKEAVAMAKDDEFVMSAANRLNNVVNIMD